MTKFVPEVTGKANRPKRFPCNTAVWVNEQDYNQIAKAAAKAGMSRASFMLAAIKHALANM